MLRPLVIYSPIQYLKPRPLLPQGSVGWVALKSVQRHMGVYGGIWKYKKANLSGINGTWKCNYP